MKSKFSDHQVSSLLNYVIVYHTFNNLLKGAFAAGEHAAHCNIQEKAITTTKALLLFVQNFPAWLALKHDGFCFMSQLAAKGLFIFSKIPFRNRSMATYRRASTIPYTYSFIGIAANKSEYLSHS